MKKTIYSLLITTTFLSFITGCNNNANEINKNEFNNQTVQIEDNNVNSKEIANMDEENLNKALSGTLNLKDCDVITDENIRNFCIKDIITTIAFYNLDISKCNELKNIEDKQYCQEKVNSEL